jgi:hypothetical protein
MLGSPVAAMHRGRSCAAPKSKQVSVLSLSQAHNIIIFVNVVARQ